jgi:hypothetical protein
MADLVMVATAVRSDGDQIETLALALVKGGICGDYANVIPALTDDEFERLWEMFNKLRKISTT